MALGTRWRRRLRACIAASAVLMAPTVAGCGSDPEQIVPVVRGSVAAGATATGTLEYVTEQKIGFPQGGRLTAIRVKVGDRVEVGQPVAEVENLEQRTALRKAQDQVRIEQLKLDQAGANNKATSAREETGDNEKQVADARRSLRVTNAKNQDAVRRAQKKLDFDEDELDRFSQRLRADQGCLSEDADPIMLGQQVDQGCIDRVRADKDAVRAAKAAILQDRADLENARNTFKTEQSDREILLHEKERDRNVAKNNADFEGTDKPFNVEVQRVTLDAAMADLQNAQKAFQDTIKPSMYSGTVDHINGQVGQVLTAAYSTVTPPGGGPARKAPGSDLIVLKDVNAYQVAVPFSEADGSRMTQDKDVEVTFDEVPGLVSQARIASIEPPAKSARAKNYLVNVVLKDNDPRLRGGFNARVNVALDKVEDTLVVPASAIQVNGRTGLMTVEQHDGTRRDVSVELGMVGYTTVEILSGAREGDRVVARRGS